MSNPSFSDHRSPKLIAEASEQSSRSRSRNSNRMTSPRVDPPRHDRHARLPAAARRARQAFAEASRTRVMETRRNHRPSARGKTQRRAELTKRTALAAALREFATFGLEGARVDRIASRAGVNKQALYYYFGNKEGLFRAALATVYERAPPMPWQPDLAYASAAMAMRALIATLFDHFRSAEE